MQGFYDTAHSDAETIALFDNPATEVADPTHAEIALVIFDPVCEVSYSFFRHVLLRN